MRVFLTFTISLENISINKSKLDSLKVLHISFFCLGDCETLLRSYWLINFLFITSDFINIMKKIYNPRQKSLLRRKEHHNVIKMKHHVACGSPCLANSSAILLDSLPSTHPPLIRPFPSFSTLYYSLISNLIINSNF